MGQTLQLCTRPRQPPAFLQLVKHSGEINMSVELIVKLIALDDRVKHMRDEEMSRGPRMVCAERRHYSYPDSGIKQFQNCD
jgi:hypothetical protein